MPASSMKPETAKEAESLDSMEPEKAEEVISFNMPANSMETEKAKEATSPVPATSIEPQSAKGATSYDMPVTSMEPETAKEANFSDMSAPSMDKPVTSMEPVTANETSDPSMPCNEMTHIFTMPFIMVMPSEKTFIALNMPFAMPPGFPNMPFVIDGLADVLIAGDPPFGKNCVISNVRCK